VLSIACCIALVTITYLKLVATSKWNKNMKILLHLIQLICLFSGNWMPSHPFMFLQQILHPLVLLLSINFKPYTFSHGYQFFNQNLTKINIRLLSFQSRVTLQSLIHSLTGLLLHAHQRTWLNSRNSAILQVLLKAS
jgi:hypothetical protein